MSGTSAQEVLAQISGSQPAEVKKSSTGTPASEMLRQASGTPSRLPTLDMSKGFVHNISHIMPEDKALASKISQEVKPAITRALFWVSDTLDQTEYGKTYKAEVAAAEANMSQGIEHMKHAQGPMAPVEGMGGLAQTGIGALAFLFSPVTALVEEGAVKPTQKVTKKVAGDSPFEQSVEDLEEIAIQGVAGAAGGEGGLARSAAVRDAAQAKAARIAAQKIKVQANLAELAVKDPEAAESLVKYVGQVDPVIEKHMRRIVKASIKASDEDLKRIGRTSAEADIQTIKGAANVQQEAVEAAQLHAEMLKRRGVGEPPKPPTPETPSAKGDQSPPASTADARQHAEMLKRRIAAKEPSPSETASTKGQGPTGEPTTGVMSDSARHAAMLRRMIPEKLGAVTRTAVNEGFEALEAEYKTPGLTGHEKAAIRERTASLRDVEERKAQGLPPETKGPEPIPKRAAEHEGEIAKRKAADPEAFKPDPDDIVYFNMGIPVTKEQVAKVFRWLGEKSPGLKVAEAKLARIYEGIIETFNPEALGPNARSAGVAIVQSKFEEARRQMLYWDRGKDRRNYWLGMGKASAAQFIEGLEKGVKFANKQWEDQRQFYKKWADEIYKQDMKTGLEYDPRDHYIAHLFKDGEGAMRFIQNKFANRWSDPRFIKERGYDLYKEAEAAGFTPKYTNPEEIMQARQHASDIAALRTNLLADFEKRGIAVRAEKGSERAPEGFALMARRSPTGQRYWVKEDADKVMFNAYDSKSLWNLQGSALARGTSQAFRGWMGVKNTLVPFKLAWSAFHPIHVTHIDAAAELTRAQELAIGNPTMKNLRDLVVKLATGTPTSPVGVAGTLYRAWWDNPKTGWPLLRFFQGKKDFASLSDADKAATHDMADGGFIPTRPKEETDGNIRKFKDLVLQHNPMAVLRIPNLVISGIGYPIYNLWIPSLKTAAYLKDVKAARELNPGWTDGERQQAFRNITRRVESRYGEMNYDTMFMNKVVKDLGVATTLSLGWNLGFLDQYGGGVMDLGKIAAGKGSVAAGTASRPLFVANYVTSGLAIGGLMTYYLAGRKPESWLDYTNPDSGEKDAYGKPIRLNTPFYTHEGSSIIKHMQQEGVASGLSNFVLSKGSGLWDMTRTTITGINNLGDEIRNPEDPAYKQLEQTIANAMTDINSISLQEISLDAEGNKAKMRSLAIGGFSPAGKYIDRSAVEGQINDEFNRYVRPKEKPFQAVQMSKDTKELRRLFKSDKPEDSDKYESKLDEVAKTYDLAPKEVAKMQKQFNKDQDFNISVYMFSKLQWAQQKPLLDKMKADELEEYLKHISKQKRAKYLQETAE